MILLDSFVIFFKEHIFFSFSIDDHSYFERYSYGHSLTYGYLIGPMKMRSLGTSIIDPKNPDGLLNWCYIFQMGLELSIILIWGL